MRPVALCSNRGFRSGLRWLPRCGQTMVQYQAVIATRNDLGQLASMQNKVVRIALGTVTALGERVPQ